MIDFERRKIEAKASYELIRAYVEIDDRYHLTNLEWLGILNHLMGDIIVSMRKHSHRHTPLPKEVPGDK